MYFKNTIQSFFLIIIISSCGSSDSKYESNTAPELVGLIDYAVDENTTDVATFTATDAQNDSISYSVIGTDASNFSIGETSGVLVFNTAPDFENPQDANTDNIYEISISASDGTLSSSLDVIVTVNDVDENPTATISVDNQTTSTYTQVILTWECVRSSSATAEGSWAGSKSLSGSESIYLSTSGTKTYTINCLNDSGQESASVDVSVGDITIKNVPSSISLFKDE
tara:strand:- start:453 stop:1130 length:678 start_codon:yes stop_codon:yes gene_type:complete